MCVFLCITMLLSSAFCNFLCSRHVSHEENYIQANIKFILGSSLVAQGRLRVWNCHCYGSGAAVVQVWFLTQELRHATDSAKNKLNRNQTNKMEKQIVEWFWVCLWLAYYCMLAKFFLFVFCFICTAMTLYLLFKCNIGKKKKKRWGKYTGDFKIQLIEYLWADASDVEQGLREGGSRKKKQ